MDASTHRVNRRDLFGAALAAMSLGAPSMAAADSPSGVSSEVLLRTNSAWNDVPYGAYPEGAPELTVMRITIPARGELRWHTHPMPAVGYLVSGEIDVEEQGGPKHRHYSAGQVIPETVDTRHRGVVGDQPAVFIVFYAGARDMPLSVLDEGR